MLLQYAYGLDFSTLQFAAFLPGKTDRWDTDIFALDIITVLFDLQCLHMQPTGLTPV